MCFLKRFWIKERTVWLLLHTGYQLLQFSWRLFLTTGKGSLSAAAQLVFHALSSSSEHDFDVCQLVIFSVAPSLEISPNLEHGMNFFDVQRFLQGPVI